MRSCGNFEPTSVLTLGSASTVSLRSVVSQATKSSNIPFTVRSLEQTKCLSTNKQSQRTDGVMGLLYDEDILGWFLPAQLYDLLGDWLH